jgi:hypothetical protein
LRIKIFWGASVNAVETQVWIAVCTYLLIAYDKKQLKSDLSDIGWAFYFLIKGISSLFVGLVSLPLMMIRNTLTLFK